MATLLSPREEIFSDDNPIFRADPSTRLLDQAQPVPGTGYLRLEGPAAERKHPASYVRGVSLSGVLQMLHLERKTCVLEVSGDDGFGTLTLVNGELVDADVDLLSGEAAAYHILAWEQPQTMILDGVSLFRHTIDSPLAHVLVEAVRRQDEDAALAAQAVAVEPPCSTTVPQRHSDWNWLVETLIFGGASFAVVIAVDGDVPLAMADENGGVVRGVSPRFAEVAGVAKAARQWSRHLDEPVDEVIVRLGDRQILLQPLDSAGMCFVIAELGAADSLELIRSAIRTLRR